MTEAKEQKLHLGVLLYGCGHHQAAWLMPDSSIERIGECFLLPVSGQVGGERLL